MPLALPPTDKSHGEKVVVLLDTDDVAAPDLIPTLEEVNEHGFFASLHLYTPLNVTPNQNTGEGPRKLGAKFAPIENGIVTYPAVDAQYSYRPQQLGTPGAVGNELYEFLVPGEKKVMVILDALDGTTDELEDGNVGDIYLIDPGVRRKGATGDGEFDHVSCTQSLITAGGEPLAQDHVFGSPES